MPARVFEIPDIGSVNIYKRRGSRTIRLSFDSNGNTRLTIPVWVPFQAGIKFINEKKEWIIKHRPEAVKPVGNGEKVGKAHRIVLEPGKVKTTQVRLRDNNIVVKYPAHLDFSDKSVQAAVNRGARKALYTEAEKLLPQRLDILAGQHGFRYRNVSVRQLKSKWGSCNQNKDITLNYYLMQLPWRLIDYVLIHELVHTEHLNHSATFWARFEKALPGAKNIRKELKPFKTAVTGGTDQYS